ncbi:hypothetical protein S83_012054 [Arachis hypogaea]|nr:uncharacterized protein LOC114927622 [Arachis hypogaea]QHO38268.1 uncharacterized protein DS421_4g118890 [Arachis hypogaea]
MSLLRAPLPCAIPRLHRPALRCVVAALPCAIVLLPPCLAFSVGVAVLQVASVAVAPVVFSAWRRRFRCFSCRCVVPLPCVASSTLLSMARCSSLTCTYFCQ